MNSVGGIPSIGQTAPVNAAPTPVERPPEQRELIQAVKALNAAEVFGDKNEVTFILDQKTRRPVVRIVDRNTNQVIRQIPPEYALRMAENLKPGAYPADDGL
ncbi:MAG TPA: flagellar protein FlaG [Bryobacteraceae bacterium]|nr:flagellar protein FlaG [Bryobacteraceae bacterium]